MVSRLQRWTDVFLGIVPVAFCVYFIFAAVHEIGADFSGFRQGGVAIVEGHSPYPSQAEVERIRTDGLAAGALPFVYPAPMAVAMVPFGLLPYKASVAVFILLLAGSCLLGLRLLGVRDWRCYGVALLGFEFLIGLRLGAISPLLVLGVAVLWRYRERSTVAGLTAAGLILAKIFLWPLLVWLVATRRFAAAVTAGAATAAALGGWALLDFGSLRAYPELLRTLADSQQGLGYSPISLGLALGLSVGASYAVALGVGALVIVGVFVLARQSEGSRLALAAGVGACLILTPILWDHYFVLLLVPIALARPRLSWLWALPLLFWVGHRSSSDQGAVWEIAYGLAVAAAVLLLSIRRPLPAQVEHGAVVAGQLS